MTVAPPSLTCPRCAGRWRQQLDFDHTEFCSIAADEQTALEADLLELRAGDEFSRDTTAAEDELAEAVGVKLLEAAPIVQPGQAYSVAQSSKIMIRLIEGERHRITFDGIDLAQLPAMGNS